jgi:hypothetical protein
MKTYEVTFHEVVLTTRHVISAQSKSEALWAARKERETSPFAWSRDDDPRSSVRELPKE